MPRRHPLPGVLAAAVFVLVGCGGGDAGGTARSAGAEAQALDGRLDARPGPGGRSCEPGMHSLKLGSGRKALMRVTAGSAGRSKAMILVLHGAGGASRDGLWAFRGGWSSPGLVLVAPTSETFTWNIVYGSDLNSVDRALKQAFARCRIDPRRIAVGGFSDGATTALSLGLINGDLFRAVMALSPGGVIAENVVGKPRVFIAHGTRDTVLPVGISDRIVQKLRAAGYSATYRRFRAGHEVPESISRAAVRWFLRG